MCAKIFKTILRFAKLACFSCCAQTNQLWLPEYHREPKVRIITVIWQITNLIYIMVVQVPFQFMIYRNTSWMDGKKTNGLVSINTVFLQVLSSVCKLSSPALGFLSLKAQ